MFGERSETSSAPEVQGRLGDELPEITGPDRGASGTFPFDNGFVLTTALSSQVLNLNTIKINKTLE